MSRIVINEKDYTTPIPVFQTTDVVFIPGFAVGGTAARGVPTLCKSITEFKAAFGSETPTFASDQPYPSGFSAAALIGLSGNMFSASSPDPSYVYALNILANGLPVVYERMNETTSDITVAAAYSYLASYVFSAERASKIPYATAVAWESGGSPYNINDMVYYPSGSEGVVVDTTKYYICLASANSSTLVPGAEGSETTWQLLTENQDTNQPLLDLGLSVKYITSGGYPTHEYSPSIDTLSIASTRGDCVALIDYLDNPNREFVGTGSIAESAVFRGDGSYGAMFAPWVEINLTNTFTNFNNHMPPSYAYLSALANSLSYSDNTKAIAGVTRGQIPGLKSICSNYILTNTIAEPAESGTLEPTNGSSINGITNISSYGQRIWGNRTLKQNSGGTTATSFLNIRNIVSDIKKTVYNAAMVTLFEPNAQITWINFTSKITPFLDTLVSNYGIAKYQIDRNMYQEDGSQMPRTTMSATITIYPVYSIEAITINLYLRDDDTLEVSE